MNEHLAIAQVGEHSWISIVNNVGVPITILVFGGLVVWRLLPHVVKWLVASTEQSHMVSEAVPGIQKSLESVAKDANQLKAFVALGERVESRVKTIEERTQRLERTADETLSTVRKGIDA